MVKQELSNMIVASRSVLLTTVDLFAKTYLQGMEDIDVTISCILLQELPPFGFDLRIMADALLIGEGY
jgi:hypothetical protein